MALSVQKFASQILSDSEQKYTQNACILSLVSVAVTTLKCKFLGLHFKIEINEITGVNQKYMLLASGLKPD